MRIKELATALAAAGDPLLEREDNLIFSSVVFQIQRSRYYKRQNAQAGVKREEMDVTSLHCDSETEVQIKIGLEASVLNEVKGATNKLGEEKNESKLFAVVLRAHT
ncbi:hypothetical protein PsorP6_012694 [Peronosclerospora sorghi]|uniref:Uncharacterized protein n=1 Tax=Peronosclerospora sorghi TaxID=230839 RepID=A0ACC0WG45_9STRA|nr:hypothetical protein PsorP6_012694 [Peronosclerospora sorghi]